MCIRSALSSGHIEHPTGTYMYTVLIQQHLLTVVSCWSVLCACWLLNAHIQVKMRLSWWLVILTQSPRCQCIPMSSVKPSLWRWGGARKRHSSMARKENRPQPERLRYTTCILNAVCLSGAINFVVQLRAFMCTCIMLRFSQFCRKYNLRKVLFLALRWRHLSVVSMTGSHVLVGAATASTSSSVRCVMPHHPVHETEEFCTRGHVTVHCIRRQNLCPVWSSVLRGGFVLQSTADIVVQLTMLHVFIDWLG